MGLVGFVGGALGGGISRTRRTDVSMTIRTPLARARSGHGPGALVVRRAVEETPVGQSDGPAPGSEFFSAAGMTVEKFFERSVGDWRSQRSSHNLAFAHFEEIMSEIAIEKVQLDAAEVVEICKSNSIDPSTACSSIRMTWEGTSDWDEDEVLKGTTLLVVVKDTGNSGRLLRSVGYAETIPAIGQWTMQADGTFVLLTPYEAAAAEERIWFATPDLRVRVSMIRTSSGRGVITSSMSSEIRQLNKQASGT